MKTDVLNDSLKMKSVRSLLNLLKQGQTGKLRIDPDYLDNVIEEINNRQLSKAETMEFENLLDFSFEDNTKRNNVKPKKVSAFKESPSEFSDDEIDKLTSASENSVKYPALKTMVGLITFLGYILMVTGIISSIYLINDGSVLVGFVTLVSSLIIALSLLAYSNLIYVFIDIESNTRITKDASKKSSR